MIPASQTHTGIGMGDTHWMCLALTIYFQSTTSSALWENPCLSRLHFCLLYVSGRYFNRLSVYLIRAGICRKGAHVGSVALLRTSLWINTACLWPFVSLRTLSFSLSLDGKYGMLFREECSAELHVWGGLIKCPRVTQPSVALWESAAVAVSERFGWAYAYFQSTAISTDNKNQSGSRQPSV